MNTLGFHNSRSLSLFETTAKSTDSTDQQKTPIPWTGFSAASPWVATTQAIPATTYAYNRAANVAIPRDTDAKHNGLVRARRPTLNSPVTPRRRRPHSTRRNWLEDCAVGFLTLDFGLQEPEQKKARKPKSPAEREEIKAVKEALSCVRCRILQIKVTKASSRMIHALMPLFDLTVL